MKNRFLPFVLALTFCWHYSQAQWTSLGSGITPTPRILGGIYPVDNNVIWGFSAHATSFTPTHEFTRTTDGGQTWLPGTMAGVESAQFPICLYALNAQTAWLATADELDPISGRMYKTTDGGTTWVHQNTGFTGFNETPAGVWFWNENEGFAYGATWYANYNDQLAIYTTANGGNNWSKVMAPNMPAQLPGEGMCIYNYAGFFSVVNDNVWFGTSKGRIFRSTDKGLTWQASSTPIAPAAITSVNFRNEQVGLAVTSSPFKIVRSTDGGQTWNQLSGTFPPGVVGAQVEYVPGTRSTWFMVAGATKYMVSYNDGDTWEIFNSSIDAWSVEFLNAKTGFAGSSAGSPKTASLFKWSGPALGNRLFVNYDATGANDGTSWANAYTDLQDALAISEAGDQIWVAEGTYKPDTIGGVQTSTFLIDKNLQLYGGFAGTETTFAQRGDPKEHPTVLSGDLNGNDLDNNPTANKLDNVLTVVRVNANITNETVIDGFTIRNGYADGGGNLSDGGGMFCSGQPIIWHCIFERNGALVQGGGVRLNSIASPGVVFENCDFKNNQANIGGGINITACYFTFKACSFSDNKAVTGALQDNGGGVFATNSFGIVQGCSFVGNSALEYGGGFNAWTTASFNGGDIVLRNCHFEGNSAGSGNGGATFKPFGDNASFTVINCDFISNTANNAAGGLGLDTDAQASNATFLVDSCYFYQNVCHGNFSALGSHLYGQNAELKVLNSIFAENESTQWYATAGAWNWQNSTADVEFAKCVFENNTAVNSAGLDVGSGPNAGESVFTVTNCNFTGNTASNFSGALSIWGDKGSKPHFEINNCWLEGNNANARAGGVWVLTSSGDFDATMRNSRIIGNQSPSGAAIDAFQVDLSTYVVPVGASFILDNCLIAGNTNATTATIMLDSFPGLQLLNCTIANNLSNGIQIADHSSLTLQNTILYNPNYIEFIAATEDATFTSHGGNLIGDNSLAGPGLLIPTDKQALNPLFVGNGDYHLQQDSPCVDAGKDDGVTAAFDLDGAPRIQSWRVDMGAYESPFVSSTREQLAGKVTLSPNPAADFLNLHLPETTTTPLQFSLFDAQGRLLQSQILPNGPLVNVQGLAAGMYLLKVTVDEKVFVGKFVKQ